MSWDFCDFTFKTSSWISGSFCCAADILDMSTGRLVGRLLGFVAPTTAMMSEVSCSCDLDNTSGTTLCNGLYDI